METVNKILGLLDRNNIDHTKFVSDLSLSPSCVSEWKSGKTKSYLKNIDKISKYFGVSSDYLLGLDEKAYFQDSFKEKIVLSLMELEIIDDYKNFDTYRESLLTDYLVQHIKDNSLAIEKLLTY